LCLCPWGDFKRWDDGKKLTRDKLMRLVCFERKGNTFAKESTRYVSSPCQGIVPSLSPEISSGVSSGLDAKGEIPSSGDTMAATGTRRMDEKDMKTDLTPFVNNLVKRFELELKRRSIVGSSECAVGTLQLMRHVVSKGKFTSAQNLLHTVKVIGRRLSDANRTQLTIGNSIRRVLHNIRQICFEIKHEANVDEGPLDFDLSLSLSKIMDNPDHIDLSVKVDINMRQLIIDEISEIVEDIQRVYDHIKAYSVLHIHAKDVILTTGYSTTVFHFLAEASKLEREFEVIVVESAPSYDGHKMAKKLAEKGIETTVITDSAVFAMMSVVNKVVIGSHAVLANGGLVARSGCHMVAAAAKFHSVPFLCVTGLYKLSPLYGFDQDTFNDFKYPGEILKFQEKFAEKVNVQNPGHDYIPPGLVSLFVTNFGGNSPSYIYRLLAEYYDPEDYDL